jgi:hypothetical protein
MILCLSATTCIANPTENKKTSLELFRKILEDVKEDSKNEVYINERISFKKKPVVKIKGLDRKVSKIAEGFRKAAKSLWKLVIEIYPDTFMSILISISDGIIYAIQKLYVVLKEIGDFHKHH